MAMKIVISGGLGYIGGRLSKYFAKHGHEVIALSRQAGQLGSIEFPSNMVVLHPDAVMADPASVDGADAFVHLAAMNENDCVKFPLKAIEVNITGTVRWLDFAKEAGICRFIYFSTAHVYAKPLEGYFDETSVTRPVHPYAITHKSAEDYVLAYAAEKGMSNSIIRLTNAFGGPAFPTADRWTLLVNDLCRAAVNTGKLVLQSDGLQQRDFICLEDVCAATLHLTILSGQQKMRSIFNVAAGKSRTVWDVANEIKLIGERELGYPLELVRGPVSATRVIPLSMSNTKLRDVGFKIRNESSYEIKSTLDFFRKSSRDLWTVTI